MPALTIKVGAGKRSKTFTAAGKRVTLGKAAGCDLVLPFPFLQDLHLIVENNEHVMRLRAASAEASALVDGRKLGTEWMLTGTSTNVELLAPNGQRLSIQISTAEPSEAPMMVHEDAAADESPAASADAGGAEMPIAAVEEKPQSWLLRAPRLLVGGTAGFYVLLIIAALGFNRYRQGVKDQQVRVDKEMVASNLDLAKKCIATKDYLGAKAALEAAEPIAQRIPSIADSRAEIERLLDSPEIKMGASGYVQVGSKWISAQLARELQAARERDDPKIAALEAKANADFASKQYESAKTACEQALAIMDTTPVKPHPELGAVQELLQKTKDEITAAEMTAKGYVRFKDRWVSTDEKFRLEQAAKGLVEYQGQWVTKEELAAVKQKTASGLVLYKGKWITQDEMKEAEGYVKYEGQWVKPQKRDELMAERKKQDEADKIAAIKQDELKKVAYEKSQEFLRKQVTAAVTFKAFGNDQVTVVKDDEGWYIVRAEVEWSSGTRKMYYCKLRQKTTGDEWEAATTIVAD